MDNYIVSARKYRPTTFADVVGQTALTTTLKNAISAGKLAHAYLFCGPRGVGKTTCARIFARTINCLSPREDGEACGTCESCQAFNENRSYNIHELDAASNNSVDDIREIIQQVAIPPQVGRFKVFIIDEVHMLSAQAFNAFLKTLEEPPSYAIFILATTEKHKILPTIISRCQIYDFARMEVPNIVAHLKSVAQKEGIAAEDEALGVIAQKADGGMRDAMSIFDQAASFSGGNITYQKIIEALNVLDYDYFFRITDALLKPDIPQALVTLGEILSKGFEGNHFVSGLAKHFRDLLVSRDEQTLPLLEVGADVRERYREQAQRCQPKFLLNALRLCNNCDMGYRTSSNRRLLVELTLIEIAQADEGPGSGRSPKKLKPLFAQTQPGAAAVPAVATKAAATSSNVAAQAASQSAAAPAAPASTGPQNAAQAAPRFAALAGQAEQAARPAAGHAATLSLNMALTRQRFGLNPAAAPKETAKLVTSTEQEPFDADALAYQWMRFCNMLPKEFTSTAERMKIIAPEIGEGWTVVVPIENDMLRQALETVRPKLTNHLRTELHNASIEIAYRQIAQTEKRRAFTPREMLNQVLETNHAAAELIRELHLELA